MRYYFSFCGRETEAEKSENCSEPKVPTQQKTHLGKPHTSPYLPDTGKCISEASKAVQPFHSMCENMQIIHELKKYKRKCSKGKQQIKYICLCVTFSDCFPCTLYGSSVNYLGHISPSELCKLPFGSALLSPLPTPDPHSAKTPNLGGEVSCLKLDEMKEAFCTAAS